MVLEATLVCVDNSEWMRNGDYAPTRLQAQADAVSLLCGQKTQSNPENTVGVLTLAGKSPRVLVTPTGDLGKVLGSMHGLQMDGSVNVPSGVQVAQLALKHRQNKNQRQRIILFAGSPIEADEKEMVKIGKKLKKNNVALDIVSFGDEAGNAEKLQALLGAVNSNDNSHIVEVPPGVYLSDALISSPVFTGGDDGGSGFAAAAAAGAAVAGAAGGGGDGFEFGVDPSLDPELALALRVSMEEERARQERAAAAEAAAGGGAGGEGAAADGDAAMADAAVSGTPAATLPGAATPAAAPALDDPMAMDDDALLQQALAMSMQEGAAAVTPAPAPGAPARPAAPPSADMGSTEDAELALALQMSMQDGAAATTPAPAAGGGMNEVVGDAGFMNSVLSSLPGVDPSDPAVQDVLAGLSGQGSAEKKEEDKEKK